MRSLAYSICLLALPAYAFNLNRQFHHSRRLAALAAIDLKTESTPLDEGLAATTRRAFGHRPFALAASIAGAVAPSSSVVYAVAPTEAEVAAAAKARSDEVYNRFVYRHWPSAVLIVPRLGSSD